MVVKTDRENVQRAARGLGPFFARPHQLRAWNRLIKVLSTGIRIFFKADFFSLFSKNTRPHVAFLNPSFFTPAESTQKTQWPLKRVPSLIRASAYSCIQHRDVIVFS